MISRPTRRLAAALLVLACSAASASGQTVSVADTDPATGAVLAMGDALSVRLTYTSDTPLRFQATGYRRGSEVTQGERMNPAPPNPAGTGEAIAWVAYTSPVEIDELRIAVWDEQWQPLRTMRVAFDARWSAGTAKRSPAAWVERLNEIQQQMTSASWQDRRNGGGWILVALPLAMLAIPGYFGLQIVAWRRWSGTWRIVALAPLFVTIPVTLHALIALAAGSNLWPLLMIFTLPFAFAYLAVVGLVRFFCGSSVR